MAQSRSTASARANHISTAQVGGKFSSRALTATPTRHSHTANITPVPGSWPSLLQAKLTISSPNDVYEQEADRVADQVMRMPDPTLNRASIDSAPVRHLSLQRKCQECEEEKLQRKSQPPHTDTPSAGLDIVAATLRQGGRPLDATTRSFFEPRFGVDFSNVRIHTNTQAAESARAVNALAYTIGSNVVFNSGQYAPHRDSGRRLLAHELTHVVQQGGGVSPPTAQAPHAFGPSAWLSEASRRSIPAMSRHQDHATPDTAAVVNQKIESDRGDARFTTTAGAFRHNLKAARVVSQSRGGPLIQRQPASDPVVAVDTECDTSETNPVLWFNYDSTQLRSDAAVDSTIHLASLIGRVRRHFASAAGLGRVELSGYASAEGDGAHNLDLSRRRAEHTRSLLESAGVPGSQVTIVGLGESTSRPGREWNRRVEICLTPSIQHVDMEPEEVNVDVVDCGHPPRSVTSLEQYSFLVACIERAMPTVGSRDMLSMLRQAYYGGGHWGEVIPCGTLGGATVLGTLRGGHRALFDTLMASKVVDGVDLGHVFTGLEAMACPTPHVEIEVPGPNPIVAMPNEEFATWGGDLGSAAAKRTHDEADRGLRRTWPHYFGTAGSMASYEDLRGDIDAFAIRAGLAASCPGTRMTSLPALTTPISQLLLGYYGAGPAVTVADRFRCSVEALGGTVAGGRITNKSPLVAAMHPRVQSFAETFYLSLVTVPVFAIGPLEAVLLLRYSGQVCELFVDWLESQL